MKENKNILPYLSATGTSIIFGLSFLFSKRALNIETVGPFTLLSFRFLTAFLIMSFLISIKIIKVNYRNKPIKPLIALGIMQPITYFIFEAYGIKFSSSSEAGLMIALIPIVVTIMGSYFLKERPSRLQVLSIFISVSGVILIVLMNSSNSTSGNTLGITLLMGAVISAAVFNILSRKLSTSFKPTEITYFMMGLGAITFNIISLTNHYTKNTLSSYLTILTNKDFIIAIIYLGVLSSVIAFLLVNFTLSQIEASKSAIFANLSTIVSIIAGIAFMHETFKYYHLIGSIMILLGVWGTNYFSLKENNSLSINKTLES